MQDFLKSESVRKLIALHLPRYHELPALELYMDQVISVTNQIISPLFPESSSPILTATMINNYVRRKLVSPPVKKRYTRDHLAYFIVVALLKPVYSIGEISAMIRRQIEVSSTESAYDRLCQELEESIQAILQCGELQKPLPHAGQADLLRAVVISLANKIYVEKILEFSGLLEENPQK